MGGISAAKAVVLGGGVVGTQSAKMLAIKNGLSVFKLVNVSGFAPLHL